MNYLKNQKISKEYLRLYRETLKQYKEICKKAKIDITHYATWPKNDIENFKRIIANAKKEMKKQKSSIISHQNYIREQISKVQRLEYKQVLTMRYIYQYKWTKIIDKCAIYEPRFDDDDFMAEYFRGKVFWWHREALKRLIKASEQI